MKRRYLTKDAAGFKAGDRSNMDVMFKQVEGDELKKELGITDLNELPDGYVAGWASTKDLDHYRHVVETGAFDESIAEKGLTGPKAIKLLAFHDHDKPAGVIKKLETRNDSLWIEAQLNLNVSYVKDLYEVAKMSGGLSFSVGFFLEEFTFKEDRNELEYLYITKGELIEVSVVVFPGNEEATMTFIKKRDDEDHFPTKVSEFEKALVASGLCKSRNEAQRYAHRVKALFTQDAPPPEPPVVATETKHLDAISAAIKKMRAAVTEE